MGAAVELPRFFGCEARWARGPRPSCRRRGGSAPQAPGGGQETASVSSWRTSLAGPSTSRQRGGKDRLGEAAQTSVALADEEPLHVVVMPPAPIPRCRVRQTLSQGRCYSVEPKRWAEWLGKSWMAFPRKRGFNTMSPLFHRGSSSWSSSRRC